MATFGLAQTFLLCFIFTTVLSQEPVVSVDEIEDGGTFSITCDASRMSDLDVNVTTIFALVIRRQTAQDTSKMLLAQYRTYGTSQETQDFPSGREWTVEFTGYNNGTNNRNTMKIVIVVSDAVCDDAGEYQCDVQYEDSNGGAVTISKSEIVTSKSAVKAITLDASMYRSSAVPGRPGYSEYEEGDNITLTCKIDGPEELQIRWKQGKCEDFIGVNITDYPNGNDISTPDPTLITSGPCSQYKHMSVLNLRSLSQDVNDQVMYLCVVMDNDDTNAPEVARANITIGITSKSTGSPPSATPSDENTENFTITVDADSVTIPEDGVTDIVALTLNRQTSQDQDFQLVAQYKVCGSRPEVTNIPPGRDWTVTFSGANGGTNNRNTMKMEIVIRDAQSSYAGLYQIIVRYTRPQDGADVDVDVTRSLTSNGEPEDEDADENKDEDNRKNEDKDDDNNTEAIIGGTMAGCIVIIVVVIVVIYAVRRQGVSTKDPSKYAQTENVDEDTCYESISGTSKIHKLDERVPNTRMSDSMHETVQYTNQL